MEQKARSFGLGVLLMVGLSGCPVTDDYYLRSADEPGGQGADSATSGAGSTLSAGTSSSYQPTAPHRAPALR
jgi:hypothetical protein